MRAGQRIWLLAIAAALGSVLAVPVVAGAQETTTTSTTTTSTTTTSTTTTSTTTTQPLERDPSWTAGVVLACGSTPETKVVDQFFATVPDGAVPQLYLADPLPDGSERLIAIGDGAEVTSALLLRWSIIGITLGPWPVDGVVTTCGMTTPTQVPPTTDAPGATLPATGAGHLATAVVVALGLVGMGATLARRRSG